MFCSRFQYLQSLASPRDKASLGVIAILRVGLPFMIRKSYAEHDVLIYQGISELCKFVAEDSLQMRVCSVGSLLITMSTKQWEFQAIIFRILIKYVIGDNLFLPVEE